jgi:fructokinase
MTNQVWVLGDAVVDLIPDGDLHYLKCPGGAPANVAVGVARLSGKSAFIGRVGDDPFGKFMSSVLQKEQVDVSHLYFDSEHHTSTVLVDLDDQGERSFTFLVQPSADLMLQADDLPEFSAGEWLHFCSIALLQEPSRSACLAAISKIHLAGGLFSFDPNIRLDLWLDETILKTQLHQVLQYADMVKLSTEELTFLTDCTDISEGVRQLQTNFPIQLILITLGADGVFVAYRDEIWQQASNKVTVVDTTGAGDAFVSGMLAGLAATDKWPATEALKQIIQQAQCCGALATTARGAMTALPTKQQVDFMLR